MPRKSSRTGRVNRKPTDERRQCPRVHTSKSTLSLVERCKGGLRLTYIMPTGRPRTYKITFGA